MNKLRGFILACIGFSTIFSYTSLFAGNRANTATLTLGGGVDFFASKRHIDNASVPFLALGYDFTQHWGVEALLGFFNTKFKPSQNKDQQSNGTLFTLDGLYHFSPYYHIVEPFVMAGIGATGISNNSPAANNEGNINAGLGVQVFIDPSIALRVDARDLYTIVGGKNDVLVTAGVTFLMGGCDPTPARCKSY